MRLAVVPGAWHDRELCDFDPDGRERIAVLYEKAR